MKLFLTLFVLGLFVFFSQSCTKETNPPVTDTVVLNHVDTLYQIDTVYIANSKSILGLWTGTYDITGGPETGTKGLYYSYQLHEDSTIQMTSLGADGMTYYGTGKWSLHDTIFSARIYTTNLINEGVGQIIDAIYDSTANTLSGTAVNDNSKQYEAKFILKKIY